MTGRLHEERLREVEDAVPEAACPRVLDLGCGDGDLLVRLARRAGIAQLVGLDISADALARVRRRLRASAPHAARIDLRLASMLDPPSDLADADCAVLVETVEHLRPAEISRLEQALFRRMRPRRVVVTTPNAEFNPLLGVPSHRFRHPGHRFEWSRAQFRRWCLRVAGAGGYDVRLADIAGCHPDLGGASQMAVFDLPGPDRPPARRSASRARG